MEKEGGHMGRERNEQQGKNVLEQEEKKVGARPLYGTAE